MKTMWKRIRVIVLLSLVCITFLSEMPAYAGVDLEDAGVDIISQFTTEAPGRLLLTGSGAMYDFNDSLPSWDDKKDSITEIWIQAEITYIGANAFVDMPNLKTVWISDVDEIHPDAFRNCPNLKFVYFRGNQADLESLIDGMEEGTAKTILSAADWQCIDKGRIYTLQLSERNADGLPYLQVTDYNTNYAIDDYCEYLCLNHNLIVGPASPDSGYDCDFNKDGIYDMHIYYASYFNDVIYTALPGGLGGTVVDLEGATETNRFLYDMRCPYYGTFKIVVPTELKASNLSLSTVNYPWTGSYIKPAVTVKANGKTLKKDTDYTVTYKNNKAIGKATLTVKGKGDYYGTATKRFNIVKAANPMTVTVHAKGIKYTTLAKGNVTVKKADVFTVKNNKGKVTFTKVSGNSKITVSSAGNITVKKGLKKGTYKVKVKVKAAGTSTYKAKTLTRTITIKVK